MNRERQSERKSLPPGQGGRIRALPKLAFLSRDIRGLAGIEFALICGFLSIAVLNVTDISVFLYSNMQVNEATQMGAQAAWATCDVNHLPVTTRCPAMGAAVTAAIQSTSLGAAVQLQAGFPGDGYYCVNSGGTLQYVSSYSAPPNNCAAAGNAGTQPGEYVTVQTTYAYAPIFPGITVAALLPSNITSSALVRVH